MPVFTGVGCPSELDGNTLCTICSGYGTWKTQAEPGLDTSFLLGSFHNFKSAMLAGDGKLLPKFYFTEDPIYYNINVSKEKYPTVS